jgi:hypothetical protein
MRVHLSRKPLAGAHGEPSLNNDILGSILLVKPLLDSWKINLIFMQNLKGSSHAD